MAWIESHTVLSRHRKVKETARALRIRPAYLIGHLHLLWHAALEQAEDGDLSAWSDEFIAESADYSGDAPQFVSLLQDHKWLDGRLLHDWLDCAGRYLIGKYAKDHRDRLVEIWAKYGRIYGEKAKPKDSPTESQLNPNQIPQTPLGKVGLGSSSPGGDARGGRPHKHAFRKSPFYPFENFRAALPDWSEMKCRHYFEQAEGYSEANGATYVNWVQAVKNWDRKRQYREPATESGGSLQPDFRGME
jgi:hypothetical protein